MSRSFPGGWFSTIDEDLNSTPIAEDYTHSATLGTSTSRDPAPLLPLKFERNNQRHWQALSTTPTQNAENHAVPDDIPISVPVDAHVSANIIPDPAQLQPAHETNNSSRNEALGHVKFGDSATPSDSFTVLPVPFESPSRVAVSHEPNKTMESKGNIMGFAQATLVPKSEDGATHSGSK